MKIWLRLTQIRYLLKSLKFCQMETLRKGEELEFSKIKSSRCCFRRCCAQESMIILITQRATEAIGTPRKSRTTVTSTIGSSRAFTSTTRTAWSV
jgi:hypothetical protein